MALEIAVRARDLPARLREATPLCRLVLGDRRATAAAHVVLAHLAVSGATILFIDACNRFDAYRILEAAPDAMRRVYVSRVTTVHQLETLVVERLAGEARRLNARHIILSGPEALLDDPDAPPSERRRVAGRVSRALREFAGLEISIFGTLRPGSPFEIFRRDAPLVYRLKEGERWDGR